MLQDAHLFAEFYCCCQHVHRPFVAEKDTCPWTGTGIGGKNMPYFSTFVGCMCICLIMDVMLIITTMDDSLEGSYNKH